MSLAARWQSQFYALLGEDRLVADELREASVRVQLASWTTALTALVVRSFEGLGLQAAAKGHVCRSLPIQRSEYLGQDIMAFAAGIGGWSFPVAVCELENAGDDESVAYSLWKVLCVRGSLRIVFCFRPESAAGPTLISELAARVVQPIPVPQRAALDGETLVVVGSRNESNTFPYGFFQAWKLNPNTGRFERFARQ